MDVFVVAIEPILQVKKLKPRKFPHFIQQFREQRQPHCSQPLDLSHLSVSPKGKMVKGRAVYSAPYSKMLYGRQPLLTAGPSEPSVWMLDAAWQFDWLEEATSLPQAPQSTGLHLQQAASVSFE